MEEYRSCPICFEVPEKEIYQCSAGHIICNVCINNLNECPQCRVNYGATRVRCRALEAILDSQEFECKFIDKGCSHICRRADISCHANSCDFNPDLTPLCELLGWKDCKFRVGACSRNGLVKHFKELHRLQYQQRPKLPLNFQSIKALKEVREPIAGQPIVKVFLCAETKSDTCPLFLFVTKISKSTGFVSFMCIKLWALDNSEKYMVEFSFHKGSLDISPSLNSTQTPDKLKIDPFLMRWTLNTYTIKEAEFLLKTEYMNVHIPMLNNIEAGAGDDILIAKISLVA